MAIAVSVSVRSWAIRTSSIHFHCTNLQISTIYSTPMMMVMMKVVVYQVR